MAAFELSVRIDCTVDAAFDFLARPANLLRITPAEAGLELIRFPERLELGSQIQFQMTGFGPVQRFVHEIIAFDEPRRFTERQVTGPLRSFAHEHRVEAGPSQSIVVIDRVEFDPPGGLLRFVVTEERVLTSLKAAFERRHRELKRLLESEAAAAPDRSMRQTGLQDQSG